MMEGVARLLGRLDEDIAVGIGEGTLLYIGEALDAVTGNGTCVGCAIVGISDEG